MSRGDHHHHILKGHENMHQLTSLKRTAFTYIFASLLLSCVLVVRTPAQQASAGIDGVRKPPSPSSLQEDAASLAPREDYGGGLLRALNLSSQQRSQIRFVREQNKEAARIARRRLGQAYQVLNESIHADNVDEQQIKVRVQEVGAAHVEVERLRAQIELQIRRILTSDQLSMFRRMRQQARGERLQQRQFEDDARPRLRRRRQ